ncbi:MAG TPA: hypothetical protein VK590_03035 [Saprospiraceae bacterium]|nr:hypothetical protein [Saprospiraceae bacterium]
MKGIYSLIGFLLFITGFVALSLSLVGINLKIISFLDRVSPLFGFVMKLLMIVGGIVMVILARTDWEKENNEAEL